MRTLIGTAVAVVGLTTVILAQSGRGASPEPVEMTVTGCLYEVSGPETPGDAPDVSPRQTTLYVLRDVARVTDDGKAAETPVATSGEGGRGGQTARPANRPGEASDDGRADQLRILFSNDTEARALVGQRVQLRGRLTPETFEEQQDAREVIQADPPPAPRASREQDGDRDRPIPQFHAEAISPLAGSCRDAPR